MIEPKTEVVQLESRLGRVGSIQAWDPWESRKSVKHAKWWVSKIARLSHGLGEAEDFEAHFDRVVNQLHHESVLEFVPWPWMDSWCMGTLSWCDDEALPARSLRRMVTHYLGLEGVLGYHTFTESADAAEVFPASAFLIEAPIFVARQWMRHRSFAYLEMSRRYVKGNRVAWEFYGDEYGSYDDADVPLDIPKRYFWDACEAEYQRRLDAGWPQELARGCMPVEAMTKFWTCGFDRDWRAFLKLRNDTHAQPEIKVFAEWVEQYLEGK